MNDYTRMEALQVTRLLAALRHDTRIVTIVDALSVGDDSGCGCYASASRAAAARVHEIAVQTCAYQELVFWLTSGSVATHPGAHEAAVTLSKNPAP